MTEKRKVFFTSLITAILIISNIVSYKVTVIANLPLNASVFVYPVCFLLTLCLTDLYGGKEARKSVYYATIIQLIVFGIFILVVALPNQAETIANANNLQAIITPTYIQSLNLYIPNIYSMIGSLLGFVISQVILTFLYDFIKRGTFKFISILVSLIFALVIDMIIFVPISNIGNELLFNDIILGMVYKLIVNVIFAFIMYPLVLIFTINKNK